MSAILWIILHFAFLLDLQHIVPGLDECVRYEVSGSSFYPGLYIHPTTITWLADEPI